MLKEFLLLAASEVVRLTTTCVVSGENVKMTTLSFQSEIPKCSTLTALEVAKTRHSSTAWDENSSEWCYQYISKYRLQNGGHFVPVSICSMNYNIFMLFSSNNSPTLIICTVSLVKYVRNFVPLQWRHNERDGVSNHLHLDCLLSRLFRRRSTKTSKLRVTGLCEGNPLVTGGGRGGNELT